MTPQSAPTNAGQDTEYAWFREGSLPHSREDRIAEILAFFTLLFSLVIGLVIALLPVSAKAATPAPAPSAIEVIAATAGHPAQFAPATGRMPATGSHTAHGRDLAART